jgi:Protein of unknown function (DUF4238)
MSKKPRVHHFVPQFWIRKFISADGKLWGYEWNDDRIKERSSKAMMQIFDLYTIQPGGADDTSLETNELGTIDTDGADALGRILKGNLSEATKLDFATFLAAQIMRDPGTLKSFRPRTQELAIFLLGVADAPDYATFAADLAARLPGADIREDEYNHIRALPSATTEIDRIITAIDAVGGLPEIPFTDLIRAPKGRDIIRNVLVSMDWHIKTDSSAGFILGDAAVLYEKSDLQSGVRTPLSTATALYLVPSLAPRQGISSSAAHAFEVDELNYESAARARLWLVGESNRIEAVRKQVTARGFG